tara:strand:- start:35 stop:262 length:228 start_codon:yes stop_codon:yes gene_type:complete
MNKNKKTDYMPTAWGEIEKWTVDAPDSIYHGQVRKQMVVDCPFGNHQHRHGIAEGSRAAHCGDGNMYNVKVKDVK